MKELKAGDYIWRIAFYGHDRNIQKNKIKRVNEKSYTLFFYDYPYIPKDEVDCGLDYYSSKLLAIENSIALHKIELKNAMVNVNMWEKQIASLQRIKRNIK